MATKNSKRPGSAKAAPRRGTAGNASNGKGAGTNNRDVARRWQEYWKCRTELESAVVAVRERLRLSVAVTMSAKLGVVSKFNAAAFATVSWPLAESIAIYERGEALKARCEALLKEAEMRIEKITLRAGMPSGTEALDPQ